MWHCRQDLLLGFSVMAAVDLFLLQPTSGLLVVGAIAMPWTSAFGPYSGLSSCDLLLDLYRMVLYVYCLKLVLKTCFFGYQLLLRNFFPYQSVHGTCQLSDEVERARAELGEILILHT